MRTRGPLLVAAGTTAVLLALAGRYGPHRDELYFVVAGRHPALGYPDQPPLSPLLAAATQAVAPHSVWALHVPSAVAVGLVCLVAAATAGELGGGPWARTVSAFACSCCSTFLVVGHELSTTTVDVLVWATTAWLVLRALRLGWRRGWLLVGLVVGAGLQNKWLVLLLVLSLAVGLVAVGEVRRALPWRWVGAAAGVALLVWAPNLVWQARHGWPQLHLAGQIDGGGLGARLGVLGFAAIAVSPLALLVWVGGLVRLLRAGAAAPGRVVGIAWLVLLGVVLAVGAKGYYLVGLLPPLLAAGVVAVEPRRRTWWLLPAWLLVGVLPVLPALLPVLPQGVYARTFWRGIVEDGRETVGWPRVAAAVAAARDSLPVAERARASVVTSNYGEAGAVDFYGWRFGLPAAHSGQNGFGLWGPPTSDGPVVVVGPPESMARFTAALTGCRQVGVVRTGIDDDEDGAVLAVCAGPRGGWGTAWPRLVRLAA